jgi:hypothetical protein
MRAKDCELYDAIIRELAVVQREQRDGEARALFKLLNVCPKQVADGPVVPIPAEFK